MDRWDYTATDLTKVEKDVSELGVMGYHVLPGR